MARPGAGLSTGVGQAVGSLGGATLGAIGGYGLGGELGSVLGATGGHVLGSMGGAVIGNRLSKAPHPAAVKQATLGGAGTAMALGDPNNAVGNWATGSAAGFAGSTLGSLAGGAIGAVPGALAGGTLGGLVGGRRGAALGAGVGAGITGTAGMFGGSLLGGRKAIEMATAQDAARQGLTPEEHRSVVHHGMGGGLAGGIGGNMVVPGLGFVTAPAASNYLAKRRLQAIKSQKTASLDRGGFEGNDRRAEREASFRDSLIEAARAKGESMQGASTSGMPNSGSSIVPSIPGY